jgi:hypothetical protein
MSNAIFLSGEWVGFYTYQTKPAQLPMHLTLLFDQGAVTGSGLDNPGAFLIEGRYDEFTQRAALEKRYLGKHTVKYEGQLENGDLVGTWCLSQMKEGRSVTMEGKFRLWPLPSDLYGEDEPLADILHREIHRKTSSSP